MKMYEANFTTIFWRLNLLIAVTVIPFAIGIPILAALALPVFLSMMLGISFKQDNINAVEAKTIELPTNKKTAA
jgi:uncharacterized membrane protein